MDDCWAMIFMGMFLFDVYSYILMRCQGQSGALF